MWDKIYNKWIKLKNKIYNQVLSSIWLWVGFYKLVKVQYYTIALKPCKLQRKSFKNLN